MISWYVGSGAGAGAKYGSSRGVYVVILCVELLFLEALRLCEIYA